MRFPLSEMSVEDACRKDEIEKNGKIDSKTSKKIFAAFTPLKIASEKQLNRRPTKIRKSKIGMFKNNARAIVS